MFVQILNTAKQETGTSAHNLAPSSASWQPKVTRRVEGGRWQVGLAWEFAVGAEGDTARDGWVGSAIAVEHKKTQLGEPSRVNELSTPFRMTYLDSMQELIVKQRHVASQGKSSRPVKFAETPFRLIQHPEPIFEFAFSHLKLLS
jgi:hypothetical protein